MDHRHLLPRIRASLRTGAFLVGTDGVPPDQRAVFSDLARAIADPGADADQIRDRIEAAADAGALDEVMRLSALCALAASPHVQDFEEAARLAGRQELAALGAPGAWRDAYLASVDRHRGAIAFLLGHAGAALEHFSRALERHRSPENIANVLAALLRLGERDEAAAMLARVRAVLDPAPRRELDGLIATDGDLARLRGLE